MGVPGESVGSANEAGAVNVLYGRAAGLTGSGSQLFTQNTSGVGSSAEAGDSLGDALAAGDFNNDGFADLAVGAPGESSNILAIGAVNVLYGGAAGLTGTGSQFFTQSTSGGDTGEEHDSFGDTLTVGDFNNDGFADLAIGVPFESVGSVLEAGAVNVLFGSAAGLTATGSQFFTQDTSGADTAEAGDSFGSTLASGDFNNDGFADLAVGVPFESVGSVLEAGAVNVLSGSAAGLTATGSQFLTQDTPGVGSAAEAGDSFGGALASGDFNHDGFADLGIGVPIESSSIVAVGAVNVLPGSAAGLTGSGSKFFTQNTSGVGSSSEEGDFFGFALGSGDFNGDGFADLGVGVPFESSSIASVGAVNVLRGRATGLTGTGSQFFTQNTAGVGSTAEEGDVFGFALAASGPEGPSMVQGPTGRSATPLSNRLRDLWTAR